MTQILVSRMRKEIQMLETDPPPGISCWPKAEKITELEAGPAANCVAASSPKISDKMLHGQ